MATSVVELIVVGIVVLDVVLQVDEPSFGFAAVSGTGSDVFAEATFAEATSPLFFSFSSSVSESSNNRSSILNTLEAKNTRKTLIRKKIREKL